MKDDAVFTHGLSFAHCWIEVDLDSIFSNYQAVRSFLKDKVQIMGIVKADAYGHGAYAIASQLIDHGVDYLGVSLPEEALKLRREGIEKPILVMSPVLDEWYSVLMDYGITPSITDEESGKTLSEMAHNQDRICPVHFEVDTGMGRYGTEDSSAAEIISKIANFPGIRLEGIFTHFAAAGDDPGLTQKQIDRFNSVIQHISPEISVPLIHASNSAAMVRYPEAHYDMVRIGTLFYGQDRTGSDAVEVKPTWAMKARLTQVRTLAAGSNIGYGSDVRLKKNTVVGVLPVGFTDGLLVRTIERPYTLREAFRLALRHLAFYFGVDKVQETVQFRGVKTPVIGRVGMQHLCIDLSSYDHPKVGEIVTMHARKAGVNPNIPKVYKWKGQWFPPDTPQLHKNKEDKFHSMLVQESKWKEEISEDASVPKSD